jgi:hypothetical protein
MTDLVFRRAALRDLERIVLGLPMKTLVQLDAFATEFSIVSTCCAIFRIVLSRARNSDPMSERSR